MRFEVARAEGERLITDLLRKFRQDTGNAKWIGRMALGPLERRFSSTATAPADEPEQHASDTTADRAAAPVVTAPHTAPVAGWSILSAAELIDYLATCDVEDVRQILHEERDKLARAAVIEAALRRLG